MALKERQAALGFPGGPFSGGGGSTTVVTPSLSSQLPPAQAGESLEDYIIRVRDYFPGETDREKGENIKRWLMEERGLSEDDVGRVFLNIASKLSGGTAPSGTSGAPRYAGPNVEEILRRARELAESMRE